MVLSILFVRNTSSGMLSSFLNKKSYFFHELERFLALLLDYKTRIALCKATFIRSVLGQFFIRRNHDEKYKAL